MRNGHNHIGTSGTSTFGLGSTFLPKSCFQSAPVTTTSSLIEKPTIEVPENAFSSATMGLETIWEFNSQRHSMSISNLPVKYQTLSIPIFYRLS